MKTCVGTLLVALAAIQMVCSTPYGAGALSSEEDIVEFEYNVHRDDSRFTSAVDGDSAHNINGIVVCGRLCCPRSYACGKKEGECDSLTGQRFPRQPQVKCPDGLVG